MALHLARPPSAPRACSRSFDNTTATPEHNVGSAGSGEQAKYLRVAPTDTLQG